MDTTGGYINLFECLYNFTDVPYPPYVYFVSIQGELTAGNEVLGDYTYTDPNWDEEGESMYHWYTANNPYGVAPVPIIDATNQSYIISEYEIGLYLLFEVTPVSVTGNPAIGDSVVFVSDMIVVTREDEPKKVSFGLFPNPASNMLNINLDKNLNKIELYNLAGRKVKILDQLNTKVANISVADLIPGLYFVKCYDQNNSHYIFKFIKN